MTSESKKSGTNRALLIGIFVALSLAIVAFYMSWTCSSYEGFGKFAEAVLSSVFGFVYVPFALLFRTRTCWNRWL